MLIFSINLKNRNHSIFIQNLKDGRWLSGKLLPVLSPGTSVKIIATFSAILSLKAIRISGFNVWLAKLYFVIQAHASVLYGFKFWKQYFFVLGSAFIMLDFCLLNTSTILERKHKRKNQLTAEIVMLREKSGFLGWLILCCFRKNLNGGKH